MRRVKLKMAKAKRVVKCNPVTVGMFATGGIFLTIVELVMH